MAAIGLAAGGGMYYAAWATTVIVLIILWVLKPIERRVFRKYRVHLIRMETNPEAAGLAEAIRQLLSAEKLEFYNLAIESNVRGSVISLRFRNNGDTNVIAALIGRLQGLDGIRKIYWDKGN